MAPVDGQWLAERVAQEVRAAYAGATWFELARATSQAHHAVEHEGSRGPGADERLARYTALRRLLDEATADVSTHCLHARL